MLTPIAPPNHWPTRTTSSTSVTLGAGDATVLCSNSSDATVALPSAATVPHQIYTVKKIGANTATVTLDPSGSETIDGASEYVLYVVGDYVVVQSDGTAWRVIGGYLMPHACKLVRAAAQSLTPFTLTKLLHDTVAYDTAGLADLGNSRMVVKRPGKYLGIAHGSLNAGGNVMQTGNSFLAVNGVDVSAMNEVQAAGVYNLFPTVVTSLDLAVGDIVESRINHASPAVSTNTHTGSPPSVEIIEQR